ncbi:MAG: tetratricopeptide repeat protein, partial [Planctomycetota bacterium]
MWTAAFCLLVLLLPPLEGAESPSFQDFVDSAEKALASGKTKDAHKYINQALERDPNSQKVWSLKVRWAAKVQDKDDEVFALHRLLHLAVTQEAPEEELDEIRAQLFGADPLAEAYFDFKTQFAEKLLPLAAFYESEGMPHAAIRINNAILALAPERTECQESIQRIASLPDPSLADSAQDKDLLADVSEQWIKWFNRKHAKWGDKAKIEKENYTTYCSAGYEVLLRTAETMENVNAFYRKFFNYGTPENDKAVPRIDINILKDEEEFRKVTGHEWAAGFYRGGSIFTYVGGGGMENMIKGVLIHEVAHQFVALATHASDTLWLNEGLATYFEGCQILSNGAVLMNMPSNSRLFALAKRMEKGWMENWRDGIDPGDRRNVPEKAPTLEMVIQGSYTWGGPWYAPVWGVIYFFFNYQDPVDGRYVYRKTFREYIDKYGGRSGGGAINKLEEMVLARPEKPTPGLVYPEGVEPLLLPKKIKELNEAWRDFIIGVRDEQSGKKKTAKPYDHWARCAVQRGDLDTAQEHFERGLREHPDDPELKMDFAKFLAGKRKNFDRASKLMLQAIRILEFQEEEVDENTLSEARQAMARWDPKWKAFLEIHEAVSKSSKDLITQYVEAKLPMMAMDMSWRLGTKLGVLDILPFYRDGYRQTGKSLWNWKMAYNEKDLSGWLASGNEEVFKPEGRELVTALEEYEKDDFSYQILTMDTVTSGDFSLEAEIYCKDGEVNLCGLLVGKKGTQNCQAVVLFPSKRLSGRTQRGYIDLATFYDDNSFDTHRHAPVKGKFPGWHKLRIDVTG